MEELQLETTKNASMKVSGHSHTGITLFQPGKWKMYTNDRFT
jgi:hypothetical protein